MTAPVAPLTGQECWEIWTALAERAHMTWGSLSPDARALWDSFASALTTRTAPA